MIPVIKPIIKTTPRIQIRESIPVLGSVSPEMAGAIVVAAEVTQLSLRIVLVSNVTAPLRASN
jgi:hypothetical protein